MSNQIRMVHGEAEAAATSLKKHGTNIESATLDFVADLEKVPWDSEGRAAFNVWKDEMQKLWDQFHLVVLKAGTVVSDASTTIQDVDRKAAAIMRNR